MPIYISLFVNSFLIKTPLERTRLTGNGTDNRLIRLIILARHLGSRATPDSLGFDILTAGVSFGLEIFGFQNK